jgi:hypothetical protein
MRPPATLCDGCHIRGHFRWSTFGSAIPGIAATQGIGMATKTAALETPETRGRSGRRRMALRESHAAVWPQASPMAVIRLAKRPRTGARNFTGVQGRVEALCAMRPLRLLSRGDWGHPACQRPPEADPSAVADTLIALDTQRDLFRIHAVLGSKYPCLRSGLTNASEAPGYGRNPVATPGPEGPMSLPPEPATPPRVFA